MNLLRTDLLELWAAFDAVEGDGFFQCEIRRPGHYTIMGAIIWCRDMQEQLHHDANEEWTRDQTKDYLTIKRRMEKEAEYANTMIYGGGGLHRYYVRINGDFEFLDSYADSEGREKARKAGFKCR